MQSNIIKYIRTYSIKQPLKRLNNKSLRRFAMENLTKHILKHHLNKSIIFNISIKQHIKQVFYLNTVLKILINNLKSKILINTLQIKPP